MKAEIELFPFSSPVRKGGVIDAALGRTNAGRYLIVFFIYKPTREALILSARDMDDKERRQYERK